MAKSNYGFKGDLKPYNFDYMSAPEADRGQIFEFMSLKEFEALNISISRVIITDDLFHPNGSYEKIEDEFSSIL